MKAKYICLLLILFSFLLFLTTTEVNAKSEYYATLSGQVNLMGTSPLIKTVIITDEGDIFTLSGDLSREIRKFQKGRVLVTGKVTKNHLPESIGKIEVMNYSLIDTGNEKDEEWAFGTVYNNEDIIVLIDDRQNIYEITNYNELNLDQYNNDKVLLVGEIERCGDYYKKIEVGGYKVISYE